MGLLYVMGAIENQKREAESNLLARAGAILFGEHRAQIEAMSDSEYREYKRKRAERFAKENG